MANDDFWGDEGSTSEDFWGDESGQTETVDPFADSDDMSDEVDMFGGMPDMSSGNEENPFGEDMTQPMPNDFGADVESPEGQVQNAPSLSMAKTTALIVCAFIVVALILSFFNGIKINKKDTTQTTTQAQVQQSETQQTQQTQQTDTTQQAQTQNTQAQDSSENAVLVAVPSDMQLGADNMAVSNAVITNKQRYLINNQVIYDLVMIVGTGDTSQTMHFYCTYSSYDAVNTGDTVKVSWYEVQKGYYSIYSVEK